MLQHFSCRFARDSDFILYVGNQHQRHSALAATKLASKVHNKRAQEFEDLVNSPDFPERLEAAVKDPNSRASRELMKQLLPLISIAGRHVPWSSTERGSCIGMMLAMARRYGPPSCFLTIAPDDVHDPTCIRLAVTHQSNESFPAMTHDFMESLQRGDDEFAYAGGSLGLKEDQLQSLAANCPAATSMGYQNLIDAVLSALYGLPAASHTRKSKPPSEHAPGFLGTPVGYFGVTEVSGRDAEHLHIVFFGGVTPDMLSACVDDAVLLHQVRLALDSQYEAKLPIGILAADRARRAVRIPARRAAYHTPPVALDAAGERLSSEFLRDAGLTVAAVQIHRHSRDGACGKAPQGTLGCRFCMDAAHPIEETRALLVTSNGEANEDGKGNWRFPNPTLTVDRFMCKNPNCHHNSGVLDIDVELLEGRPSVPHMQTDNVQAVPVSLNGPLMPGEDGACSMHVHLSDVDLNVDPILSSPCASCTQSMLIDEEGGEIDEEGGELSMHGDPTVRVATSVGSCTQSMPNNEEGELSVHGDPMAATSCGSCTQSMPSNEQGEFSLHAEFGGGAYRGCLEHEVNQEEAAELDALDALLDGASEHGSDASTLADSDAVSVVLLVDSDAEGSDVEGSGVEGNDGDPAPTSIHVECDMDVSVDEVENGASCRGDVDDSLDDEEATLDARMCVQPLIPRGDSQCIVWELERPSLDMFNHHPELLVSKGDTSKEALERKVRNMSLTDLRVEWDNMLEAAPLEVREELNRPEWESVRKGIQNASPDAFKRLIIVWGTMLCANAEVTAFSHVLSACVRCNTAHLQLGAREASRCAMFYMVKYLTKDSTALGSCLSTLLDVHRNAQRWESTAEDSGTRPRNALWFLQKCVNRFHKEISATQAASLLLGDKAHISSNSFHYASPWLMWEYALELRKELGLHGAGTPFKEPDGDTDMRAPANDDDDEDDDDFETVGGESKWTRERDARDPAPGYSKSYTLDDGTEVVVPVAVHYRFRGTLLARFNYMEWESCIEVVAMTDKQKEVRAASLQSLALAAAGTLPLRSEELTNARRGAQPSGCFPFHAAHPLVNTHWQRMRREVHILQHSGKSPPQEPPLPKAGKPLNISWLDKRELFAQYMAANFVPWAVSPNDHDLTAKESNCPPDLSSEALAAWMSCLSEAATSNADTSTRRIARGRRFELGHYVHALRVNKKHKHVLSQLRGRNRTLWPTPNEGNGGPKERSSLDLTNEEQEALVAEKELAALRKKQARSKRQTSEDALEKASKLQEFLKGILATHGCSLPPLDDTALPLQPQPKPPIAEAAASGFRPLESLVGHDSDAPLKTLAKRHEHMREFPELPLVAQAPPLPPNAPLGGTTAMGAAYEEDPPELMDLRENEEEKLRPLLEQWKLAKEAAAAATPPLEEPLPPLNNEQRAAGRAVIGALRELERARRRKHWSTSRAEWMEGLENLQRLFFLNGAAGTGKTALIKTLDMLMQRLGLGQMLLTAYSGTAVVELENAMTSLTLFNIPISFGEKGLGEIKDVKHITRFEQFARLPPGDYNNLRLVVLDEISFVSPALLEHISQRLEWLLARDSGLDFGGVVFLAAGDFHQKPGVAQKVLHKELLRSVGITVPNKYGQLPKKRASNNPHAGMQATAGGVDKFRKCQRLSLTVNNRFQDDKPWGEILAQMRELQHETPVGAEFRSALQVQSADEKKDPDWIFAPIGVVSNDERHHLNAAQAYRWAQYHGLPLVRWKLPLKGMERLEPAELTALYEEEPSLWGYFVKGAPAVLTVENLSQGRGLVNGTRVTLDSITMDQSLMLDVDALLHSVGPGGVVTLPQQPLSIQVRPDVKSIFLDRLREFSVSTDPNDVVISILQSSLGEFEKELSSVWSITHVGDRKVACQRTHLLELGFAFTDYKMQGKSVDRFILSLAQRESGKSIDLTSVYVLASRVRTRGGLRALSADDNNFAHLSLLRPAPELAIWDASYDENGFFSPQRAADAAMKVAGELQATHKREMARKTKEKREEKKKEKEKQRHDQPSRPRAPRAPRRKLPPAVPSNFTVHNDGVVPPPLPAKRQSVVALKPASASRTSGPLNDLNKQVVKPQLSRASTTHASNHEAPFITHALQRLAFLRKRLKVDPMVKITVAGSNGTPSLGQGLAKSQWIAAYGKTAGTKAHASLITALRKELHAMKEEFGDRINYSNMLPIRPFCDSHYQVWGANLSNFSLPLGQAIDGAGMAASMQRQEPGFFGIITTPCAGDPKQLLKSIQDNSLSSKWSANSCHIDAALAALEAAYRAASEVRGRSSWTDFCKPLLVHSVRTDRDAPTPADIATPLLAWTLARDAIAQAPHITDAMVEDMQRARDEVRAATERAIALKGRNTRNYSEAEISLHVQSQMDQVGYVVGNVRHLLGNCQELQQHDYDAISIARGRLVCSKCGFASRDALGEYVPCISIGILSEQRVNPIEAFQRIINGLPIGDHACDEEGLVCEGCGVPSSSNMLNKPLTNLDLPNASRPPLLLLECETSYCDGVPSSTVKFADIDAYDLSLPGDGHSSRRYQLIAVIQSNGSHFVTDVRGNGAGGPVIGASMWSRIDGMSKPHPCAEPIGPPDGSMDSKNYRPVCAIYCELL